MRKDVIFGLAVVAATAYYFSGPYRLAYNLTSAIKNKDVEQLQEAMDFPAMRRQVKLAIFERLIENGSLAFVDSKVDTFVNPKMILALFAKNPNNSDLQKLMTDIVWTSLTSVKVCLPDTQCGFVVSTSGFDNWRMSLNQEVLQNGIVLTTTP